MQDDATPKGGFWMLIEEIGDERAEENKNAKPKAEPYRDEEFYPDSSF